MPNKLTDAEASWIRNAVEKCVIHKKCKNCVFEDESGCVSRLLYQAYRLIEHQRMKYKEVIANDRHRG